MSCLYLRATYDPERHARFLPASAEHGSLIIEALREARRLADRLECSIEFECNGQLAWIHPGQDPDAQYVWLTEMWQALKDRCHD